jgi:hypothetical protein
MYGTGLDLPNCFFMSALVVRRTYSFPSNLIQPNGPVVACGQEYPHENIDPWSASKGRGDLTACFSAAHLVTYLVQAWIMRNPRFRKATERSESSLEASALHTVSTLLRSQYDLSRALSRRQAHKPAKVKSVKFGPSRGSR